MDSSIELDRENDHLSVLFRAGAEVRGRVAKTVRLTEDVVADLDADGKLIGLDLAQASEILGSADLGRLSVVVALGSSMRQQWERAP